MKLCVGEILIITNDSKSHIGNGNAAKRTGAARTPRMPGFLVHASGDVVPSVECTFS
jgi:hypothetical protein